MAAASRDFGAEGEHIGNYNAGNNQYLRKHPRATTAVVRAVLKAADICASDPTRAARRVIERKADDDYDNALSTMRDIPYGKWREHDSADTMPSMRCGFTKPV